MTTPTPVPSVEAVCKAVEDALLFGAALTVPDAVKLATSAIRSALLPQVEPDMRAFGASEVAAYRWPDDTPEDRAARAAFCDGAASASPAPSPEAQAEVERRRGEANKHARACAKAVELLSAAEAENAALKARVAVLVDLLDKQFGTPCEQIRHQQEIEEEREACAREADAFDQSPGDDSSMGPVMVGQVEVAQSIATAIRARSARAGTDTHTPPQEDRHG